jgi:hypothetical protein
VPTVPAARELVVTEGSAGTVSVMFELLLGLVMEVAVIVTVTAETGSGAV